MNQSEIDSLLESKVSRRRHLKSLEYGVGHYDVEFPSTIIIDGIMCHHSAHRRWSGMLSRCYKPHTEQLEHSYAGCTVAEEWLRFSNFLAFWKENYRDGYVLDKDLLHHGNKIYGPEYCVFVPPALNLFTGDRARLRGKYPQGVIWHKQSGKFRARINVNGKISHLGLFNTTQEAHLAWHTAKMQQAKDWKPTCDEIHPLLHAGLMKKIAGMQQRFTQPR
ncbi:TPA: hypothetical protein ACNOH0_004167 [Enterobacter hormaechei]|uniref:hypothetical protein n=1 Tax=Enterobacter hormaechei TaxID=158836 RepID=UPI003B87CA7B